MIHVHMYIFNGSATAASPCPVQIDRVRKPVLKAPGPGGEHSGGVGSVVFNSYSNLTFLETRTQSKGVRLSLVHALKES